MKVLSVVGTRPQFVKAAAVSEKIRARHEEILVHTGQHYDHAMSKVFFDGLGLPAPDHNLDAGPGRHGEQTGKMLARLEDVLLDERPDLLLCYGDTNSTLAGALAAAKLEVPVAHVEAGLRSFNRSMPEEVNRVVTDHVSALLFCPTPAAVENLTAEGIRDGVHLVGDVMFDVAIRSLSAAEAHSTILEQLDVAKGAYFLATAHRPSNTDVPENLRSIVEAFLALEAPVIFPVHPRTKKRLEEQGLLRELDSASHIKVTPPLGYLDFVKLQKHARRILTDSGGVQKEAWFHGVPCVTLREDTEWVETLEGGWNVLVGSDKASIIAAASAPEPPATSRTLPEYADGHAAQRTVDLLNAWAEEIGDCTKRTK